MVKNVLDFVTLKNLKFRKKSEGPMPAFALGPKFLKSAPGQVVCFFPTLSECALAAHMSARKGP